MRTSAELEIQQIYTREQLADRYQIQDKTLYTGIFKPEGHDSVWLFVTELKTPDRPQYRDFLDGNTLFWEGQTAGRKDRLIIEHEASGIELLVFYRASKSHYPHAGFKYEGPFRYVCHGGSHPTRFVLHRVSGLPVSLQPTLAVKPTTEERGLMRRRSRRGSPVPMP